MSEYFMTSGTPAPKIPYTSRRSPVYCTSHMSATSQPLATAASHRILSASGNAVAAAIAAAAVLAVVEPCSTGVGGDMFALVYDATKKKVQGITGCGRLPADASLSDLDLATCDVPDINGKFSGKMVTVPGAIKGWWDLYSRYCDPTSPDALPGKHYSMPEILSPAISLARDGFPVPGPITSNAWRDGVEAQVRPHHSGIPSDCPFTNDSGVPPKQGEVFKNPELARVLSLVGSGPEGFYEGSVASAIVQAVTSKGGKMTEADLASHTSEWVSPISRPYRGVTLHEIPPPGQGVAGLVALQMYGSLEGGRDMSEGDEAHAMVESMRVGFERARAKVEDGMEEGEVEALFEVGDEVDNFDWSKTASPGSPPSTSCTVSFQTYDSHGSSVSFVNSNYMGFGTGIVPAGLGFTLQNRGCGFYTAPGVNSYSGGSRPYHTIIPAMATRPAAGGGEAEDFVASLSNMGGYMQPQGHLQLMVNLFGRRSMNAQEAV
eukprot:CAMPEP_0182473934 /NCGR_PEP_ID=MMETSP1319-20130603/24767_1 /TAXON_ID=172717 /ORGANISM="Bolidomonas pacifica, Strain RCC208" /LENGTH=489 /DNA_ID=CAMNT_0024674783 /DNA_START=12 /DNA_END=1477 /DNA_ORIENTATION=-